MSTLTDMSWRWQSLGGMMMLVTDGGGAKVVLSASHARVRVPCILTRDDGTGLLRAIRADDEVASLIQAAPDMLRALEEMVSVYREECADEDEPSMVRQALAAIAKAKGKR